MKIVWTNSITASISKLIERHNTGSCYLRGRSDTTNASPFATTHDLLLFINQLSYDADKGFRIWNVVGDPSKGIAQLDTLRPIGPWKRNPKKAINAWREIMELDLHGNWSGAKVCTVFLDISAKADRDYLYELDRRDAVRFESTLSNLICLPTQL